MLKSALFYRQAKSGVYEDPDLSENVVHGYLPWTASKEMRTCLTEQVCFYMCLYIHITPLP